MATSTTSHQQAQPPALIILSGLSGSGKSTALQALEDQGYFCIDNLPLQLIPALLEQQQQQPQEYALLAIGLDARSKRTQDLATTLDHLLQAGLQPHLLFLTASDSALLQRYNATRRGHPLADTQGLSAAISRERELLTALSEYASDVIDTSAMNVHELRLRIIALIGMRPGLPRLLLQSFAFTRGLPADVDIVFDARCLPNPHWQPGLRELTGRDQPVQAFLQQSGSATAFLDDTLQWLLRWLPHYSHSTRSQITIGVGCTGGRHRSVYAAEALASGLRAHGERFCSGLSVCHRDLPG